MRLRLFGTPEIQNADGSPRSVSSRNVHYLLAYLWLHRDQPQPRQHLAGVLWPDTAPRTAQSNLRTALHGLKTALAADDGTVTCLHVDDRTIQFHADTSVWIDVEAFEAGIAIAEAVEDPKDRGAQLEAACQLYRGPFLHGGYAEWMISERDRLRDRYLDALGELIRALAQTRAYDKALEWTERALAEQPFQEAVYRQRMALFYASGVRDAALQAYERCREMMAEQLGVKPSQTTEELRRRIADETALADLGELVGWPTAPPHNLPQPRSGLIGRAEEMEEIQAQFRSQRLVTLTGLGGVGKTRLALELARASLELFEDGVWLVDLGPVDETELVPNAIAQSLDVPFDEDRPLDAVAQWLDARRALLVLDNAEHVREACAHAAQHLLERCSRLRILVTSRARLGLVDEVIRPVPPLELPETDTPEDVRRAGAARLFIERARAQHMGFRVTSSNAPAVERICRRLGGLPLGIELNAAWARMLSPEEIAQAIESNADVLTTAFSYVDLPERSRNLEATFAHSWALLSETERDVLERLAVFQGTFDRTAAEEVAGASLTTLASLGDKSLLQIREPGRYEMHALMRQYARERLARDSQRYREAVQDHGEHFAEQLECWEPELKGAHQHEALNVIHACFQDIRAMWETALEWGKWEWIERSLDGVHLFCEERSRFREGKRLLKGALEAIETATAPGERRALKGRIRVRLGKFLSLLGQPVSAERRLREGLTIAREREDQAKAAVALNELGSLLLFGDNPQEARAPLEEALAIRREIDDRQDMAETLHNLGNVELVQGNLEASRQFYQESLVIRREFGDKYNTAMTLNNLGNVEQRRGHLASSHEYYEESLDMKRELGNKRGVAITLMNLGIVESNQGNLERSSDRHEQSLAIRRELGDKHGMATSLSNLGKVERSRGNLEASRKCHEQSLAIKRELGDRSGEAMSLNKLGQLEQLRGNLGESYEYHEQSLTIHRELAHKPGMADSLMGLGYVEFLRGSHAKSRAYLAQSLELLLAIGSNRVIAENLTALAAALLNGEGETVHAARLQGVATAVLALGDAVLDPEDQVLYDESAEILRETLGEAEYHEAFDAGRSMTLEEALALVTDVDDKIAA